MKTGFILITSFVILMLSGCKAALESFARDAGEQLSASDVIAEPSAVEVADALKQALGAGVERAITRLGRTGGFNTDNAVRIPMPDELVKVEAGLRKLGQQRYADQFVVTMNRAAEQAVPEAATVFAEAIRQLSIQDVYAIIRGPDDAATRYFQRTSGPGLVDRFLPIVAKATDEVRLTQAYKRTVDGARLLGISVEAPDLDAYVTQKASDALFLYIAAEEQRIREQPLARSTELLKKVFGYYSD